jgi:hypothetical protein
MDEFQKNLQELSYKVSIIKNQIVNEEATKTSLILPLFRLLGYDIEDPMKMIPEYVVNNDRVDYSIMQNNSPLLFIEAKNVKEDLNKHIEQARKYFNNSDTKIICLTNGLMYNFYSDINKDNVMDEEPFLSLNIENITDFEIKYLKNLSIDNFTMENYRDIIFQIKTTEFIRHQLENPSEEFVRFVANNISSKKKTKKFLEKIKHLIFNSIKDVLNIISKGNIVISYSDTSTKINSQIVTTEEELEGYKIIVSILSEVFSVNNLNYKDTTKYFAIIADKKPGQWIARLYLGIKKKSIMFPDGKNGYIRHQLNSIEDLYNYRDELIESASKYLAVKVETSTGETAEIMPAPIEVEEKKKRTILERIFH